MCMCVSSAGNWIRSAGIAVALLLAPVGHASAQNSLSNEDLAAIRGMISDQLAAFVADDGERAFSHASPGIKAMFGNAATFMAMVRGGYPSVYRARRVTFRDIIEENGRTAQPVMVVGPDGVPVLAMYSMERQPDGGWRIDGVVLLEVPNSGA